MEIQIRTTGKVTIIDLAGNLTIGKSEEGLRDIVKQLIAEERIMLLLNLATWFHDTGYAEGPKDHEERSCHIVSLFLQGKIAGGLSH